MAQKPDKIGSIVSETDLVNLVVGAGYVAVMAVRHTGKAWHCMATAEDGSVDPVTVDPKGRIHVDTNDDPDEPPAPEPAPTP